MKSGRLTYRTAGDTIGLELGGARGILGEAVKCYNPQKTTDGEGILLEQIRQSGMKARGANRIRYPSSPSRKRCELSVAYS